MLPAGGNSARFTNVVTTLLHANLRGQWHEIFDFRFFHESVSPKTLSIPSRPPDRWYRWCTLTCDYIREFVKKFEMTLMLFAGAWGKMIHGKNMKQKTSLHCPFKHIYNTHVRVLCTEGMGWLQKTKPVLPFVIQWYLISAKVYSSLHTKWHKVLAPRPLSSRRREGRSKSSKTPPSPPLWKASDKAKPYQLNV
jgi:hypothetical protein